MASALFRLTDIKVGETAKYCLVNLPWAQMERMMDYFSTLDEPDIYDKDILRQLECAYEKLSNAERQRIGPLPRMLPAYLGF